MVSPLPQAYYVAIHPMHSIANENKPLLSCSPFVDLVSTFDVVPPSMGELEPTLPYIDPSEFSFQDVLPLDEYILEAIVNLDIPSDVFGIVLSNDHIFEQDCPTTEPNPNFPFELDLTICRSS